MSTVSSSSSSSLITTHANQPYMPTPPIICSTASQSQSFKRDMFLTTALYLRTGAIEAARRELYPAADTLCFQIGSMCGEAAHNSTNSPVFQAYQSAISGCHRVRAANEIDDLCNKLTARGSFSQEQLKVFTWLANWYREFPPNEVTSNAFLTSFPRLPPCTNHYHPQSSSSSSSSSQLLPLAPPPPLYSYPTLPTVPTPAHLPHQAQVNSQHPFLQTTPTMSSSSSSSSSSYAPLAHNSLRGTKRPAPNNTALAALPPPLKKSHTESRVEGQTASSSAVSTASPSSEHAHSSTQRSSLPPITVPPPSENTASEAVFSPSSFLN